jgi:hypothetical protein
MLSARTQLPVGTAGSVQRRHARMKKEIVMGRIVLAGLVLGLCASLAAPVLAQTNEACMLRCLDHFPYLTCHARCTKAVPPVQAPTIRRAAPPTNVPPAASTSPAAAPSAPPPSAQPAPAAPQPSTLHPAVTQPAPQPSALQPAVTQPAPQPSVQPPAQPAANQAPPQPTGQATSQQSAQPSAPPRPVNEACVLRCLDHGRLYPQCQAMCAQ